VTRTPTSRDLVAGLHKKVKGLIHLLGKIVVDAAVDQSEARRRLAYDPWLATDGFAGPFFLNRELLKLAGDGWREDKIRERTKEFADLIIGIWPVPEGHKSAFSEEIAHHQRHVEVIDLISAGLLEPGQTLYPRSQNPKGHFGNERGAAALSVPRSRKLPARNSQDLWMRI
jgi:hypothetical protein